MRKHWFKLVLSIAIGAGFIWLAMREVHWDEFTAAVLSVDPWILVEYFLLLCFVHLVRVLRWGLLLKPLGRIGFYRLFSVSSVGIMALTLMPLRLGEFARPILIAERGKIRISAALATVVVERVADSLAMTLLLVAILMFIQGRVDVPAEIHLWGWGLLGLFVLILVFLVFAYRHPEPTVRWFKRRFAFLPTRLVDRLCSILASFIGGLRALPDARLIASFVASTVFYWWLNGAGMLLMFKAFDGLASLGWLEAFTALAVLCVGLMIPAGPAMAGNFQYFVKLGLSLFVPASVLGSTGMAYAVLLNVMQVGQQVLFALPFLFSSHISLSSLLGAPRTVEADLQEGQCPDPGPEPEVREGPR